MYYQLILQNHVDGLSQSSWTLRPPGVVGRDATCQVCIDHPSISRQHCQFSLNGEGTLVVKDLDSMNGIYIDDTRVKHAALMPGEVLQIGALRLHIEFTTGGDEIPKPISRPKGSVAATQPMKAVRLEPRQSVPLENRGGGVCSSEGAYILFQDQFWHLHIYRIPIQPNHILMEQA